MGKYRLEEYKRRVTERREETDIMRERGETKIESERDSPSQQRDSQYDSES